METLYHSTRSNAQLISSKQAIFTGISPDGGLFVSDQIAQTPLALNTVCANDPSLVFSTTDL